VARGVEETGPMGATQRGLLGTVAGDALNCTAVTPVRPPVTSIFMLFEVKRVGEPMLLNCVDAGGL
jgi:hypothetical protein